MQVVGISCANIMGFTYRAFEKRLFPNNTRLNLAILADTDLAHFKFKDPVGNVRIFDQF